jgi:hypothetical protein
VRSRLRAAKRSYGFKQPVFGVRIRYKRSYLERALEDSARTLFDVKASEWLADTSWVSSMSVVTAHPAFDDIKRLGDRAVKFTLQRMAGGDVHLQWFPLLHDLAGIDPVQPEARGFVPQMTDAWLQWGRQTGRI